MSSAITPPTPRINSTTQPGITPELSAFQLAKATAAKPARGRNPHEAALHFVNGMNYKLSPQQKIQVVKFIEKRFLYWSADDGRAAILNNISQRTRGQTGLQVLGTLRTMDRENNNKLDPVGKLTVTGINVAGGATAAIIEDLAPYVKLVLQVSSNSGQAPNMAYAPPGMQTTDQIKLNQAVDKVFHEKIGDEIAALYVGADPNSAAYKSSKAGVGAALVISYVVKLAPGAIRMVKVGNDIRLVFRDAAAFEKAAKNPELRSQLAIAMGNRGYATEFLPKQQQIAIKKLLKENAGHNPDAAAALKKMPASPPRTALVNKIVPKIRIHEEVNYLTGKKVSVFSYEESEVTRIRAQIDAGCMSFAFKAGPKTQPTSVVLHMY